VGSAITSITTRDTTIQAVKTDAGDFTADHYVLAAGAWSAELARTAGLELLVEPAKGYSYTFPCTSPPALPLLLGEAHVVVTPFDGVVRMTGGLELAGFDRTINPRRVEGMKGAVACYLTGLDELAPGDTWFGYRPLTPDGLPILGPSKRFTNLIYATGHGTLGMTLAPITGKIVAEYVGNSRSSVDLEPFSPDRFDTWARRST
jgi:D-amino-acid dehydrogenase